MGTTNTVIAQGFSRFDPAGGITHLVSASHYLVFCPILFRLRVDVVMLWGSAILGWCTQVESLKARIFQHYSLNVSWDHAISDCCCPDNIDRGIQSTNLHSVTFISKVSAANRFEGNSSFGQRSRGIYKVNLWAVACRKFWKDGGRESGVGLEERRSSGFVSELVGAVFAQ